MIEFPQTERPPRGGSDTWDTVAAGVILVGELFSAQANVAAADFKGSQGQLAALESQWRGAVWSGGAAVHAAPPPPATAPAERVAAVPQHFDLTVQGRIFRVNVAALQPPPLGPALFAGPQLADLTVQGMVHGQPPRTVEPPPLRRALTAAPQQLDGSLQAQVFRAPPAEVIEPDVPATAATFHLGTHELAVRDGQFRGWVRGQTPPTAVVLDPPPIRPFRGAPQAADLTVQGRVRMALSAALIRPPNRPELFASPQHVDLTLQGRVQASWPVQAPGLRAAFLARPQLLDETQQGAVWGPQPPTAVVQDPAPVAFLRGAPQQLDGTVQGRFRRQPPPNTPAGTHAASDFKGAQGQLAAIESQFRGAVRAGPVHFPVPVAQNPPQRPWASRNQENPEQRPSRVWAQVPPSADPATFGAIVKIDYAAKQGQLQVMDSQFRGALWRSAVHLPQFVAPGSPRGARRDLFASPQLTFYDRNPSRVIGQFPPSTAPTPPPLRPALVRVPQEMPALQRGSHVYGPVPPDPSDDKPQTAAEFRFGVHAKAILDSQFRGRIWGALPPSIDPPPPQHAFQLALPQVLPEQPKSSRWGPQPPDAPRNPPPLRPTFVGLPQQSPEQPPSWIHGVPPPPPPVPVITPRAFVSRNPQSPEQTFSRISGAWAQVLPVVLVEPPTNAAEFRFGTHAAYIHSLQTGGRIWRPIIDPPFLNWNVLAARDELENIQGAVWARSAVTPSVPPQISAKWAPVALGQELPPILPSWVRAGIIPTAEAPPLRPLRVAPQESPEQQPSFVRGPMPPDVERVAPPEGVFRFAQAQEGRQWNPSRIRAVWIPPPPLGFNPGPILTAGYRQEGDQQVIQPRLERLSAEFMPVPPTPSPYVGAIRYCVSVTPVRTVRVVQRFSTLPLERYSILILSRR